jgi:DNA-binding Lrp family transcriptional regulator
LGWGVLAFVSVAIESHSEEEARAFETAVAALPEIVACWSITGSSDFLLQVVASDLDSYAEFAMTTIRRLPGIKAMQSALMLKEVKAPAPWPIPGVEKRAARRPRRQRAKR